MKSQWFGKKRRGHTLMELVAASTMASIAITSTLTIMGSALDLSLDVENRKLATTLCVSKLEEHCAAVTASFTEGMFTGDFSTDGYPQMKFTVARTTNVASGGMTNSLMVIQATVYMDSNSNNTFDSAEPFATMMTKVAKLTAWEF